MRKPGIGSFGGEGVSNLLSVAMINVMAKSNSEGKAYR